VALADTQRCERRSRLSGKDVRRAGPDRRGINRGDRFERHADSTFVR
jgi:hypothetical protein